MCHKLILYTSFSWKIALILTRWESSLCIMRQNFYFPSWQWQISDAEELIFITCKENIQPRGGHNWSWLSSGRPKLLLGLEVEFRLGVQELLCRERKVQGYWDAVTDVKEQFVILLSPPTTPGLFFCCLRGVWEERTRCLSKGEGKKEQILCAKHPGDVLGSISCWSANTGDMPCERQLEHWDQPLKSRGFLRRIKSKRGNVRQAADDPPGCQPGVCSLPCPPCPCCPLLQPHGHAALTTEQEGGDSDSLWAKVGGDGSHQAGQARKKYPHNW